MIRLSSTFASVVTAALLCGASAFADNTDVIYTEIATSPTGVVPGAVDAAGNPVVTNWLAIEDLALSPDGSTWVLKGRTTQATTNDSILLLGGGLSGTMFAQDGQPVKGGVAGELYDFFDTPVPASWDDNGNFAYGVRAKGGVASVFEKVVVYTSSTQTHTIVAQMGDPALGCIDVPANPTGDELFGNSINSIHLLNSGGTGFVNTPITNCHSSRYPAYFISNTAFIQSGVTPVNAFTGPETWDSVSLSGGAYMTPDTMHYFAIGDTENSNTSQDGILVVDGVVVAQEGFALPTQTLVVKSIFFARMLNDGTWFARGDDSASDDWAVRNGVLLAKTGDPITVGNTETWGITLSSVTGNTKGDWVLAGNTSETNVNIDNVLVFNGKKVIAREGDPVDVDGNGMFDDDAYIASFQPGDIHLTDDCDVYYLVTLRNGALTSIGDGFLRTKICGEVSTYGMGCPGTGGFTPALDMTGCPRAGQNVTLSITNGLGGSQSLLLLGLSQASIPAADTCVLLLNPLPGMLVLPLGGVGAGNGALSLPAMLPANTPSVTFQMQVFVADNGVAAGYSNSNGVEVTIK